mgnify:CR=1 FL=1
MTQEMKEYCKSLGIKEYRLMYFFGCWITSQKIYAENDAEAIHDANEIVRSPMFRYALWQGNRKVLELQEPTFNDGIGNARVMPNQA